jgi:hypothetical protein
METFMKSATRDIKIYFILLGIFSLLFLSCKEESNPVTPLVQGPSFEMNVTFAPIEVKSTDGKVNLLYGVETQNFEKEGYALKDFQVLNAANETMLCSRSDTGKFMLIHKPASEGIPPEAYYYPFNGHLTYRFSIGLVLDPSQVPQKLKHRLVLSKDGKEKIIEGTETAVSKQAIPVISAPFKGEGFYAANTTTLANNQHPSYQMTYMCNTTVPERFCIDWNKFDDKGSPYHDDINNYENWYVYGQDVFAVSSGQVVYVNDGMPDQFPVGTITGDINQYNSGGNSVIISTAVGFTIYSHFKLNSVLVKMGQNVKKGELIGKVGNSGNSGAPHLHFGLNANFPWYISEGLPYYIDSLEKVGTLAGPLPSPEIHTNELVENGGVYNFK